MSTSSPSLVRSLARLAREYPLDRKLLVAPNSGAGRELLRCLARSGEGWMGFEVTTVRPLALRVARASLDRAGLRVLDSFEHQALVDEALDETLTGARAMVDRLRELSEGVGFRAAIHDAVDAMRLAGVEVATLRRAPFGDREKRTFLTRLLERYESLLVQRRRADTATVLSRTVEILHGDPTVARRCLGGQVVALLPGLGIRGLSGQVVEGLRGLGAEVLETDAVRGLEAPESIVWASAGGDGELSWLHAPDQTPAEIEGVRVELFHAASPTDELREVLRRVVARGLPWDEVEIVTPDPAAYGSALHELASRLGVPVTYAVGLPVERTRPGRVVQSYLDWIAEGFQAAPMRRLLEAGDLRPAAGRGEHSPATLARRFRRLRIGWGRLRYRRQIKGALAALDDTRPGPNEGEDRFQRRVSREREELLALRNILFPTLKATPSVPDRLGEGGQPVSPSELAAGLRAFLRRVAPGDGADAAALERILTVLERVEVTLRRRTDFAAAVTILRRHLEIRVRAPDPAPRSADERGAPWRSEGGYLHLTDLEHGGFSGRSAVFLVGVDADRVPGGGSQDPVLLDRDRRALSGDLPTGSELLRERIFRMAALLARIRGSLTASYASWSAADGRVVPPSSLLLDLLRLRERDPSLSFEDVRAALGPVACALPSTGMVPLDGDDAWMRALNDDGLLRSGLDVVRRAYPGLDAGLHARAEREQGRPGPHHGVVASRPDVLDPRAEAGPVLSASRLETLGTCGLRYLYDSVLRVRPPDDLELDPDRWLDPLARGGILHEVFERSLRLARERGVRVGDPAMDEVALEVLDQRLGRARADIPSPGAGVARREAVGLQEDVRSFVRMLRDEGAPWARLELTFGLGDDDPLSLSVPGGEIRLRGAVDRVDEDLEGLHVIDYKTGRPWDFQSRAGVFNGGRRLQHAVYALIVGDVLRRDVVTGAYHFPTRRGENQAFAFSRSELAPLRELLGHLLDAVAAGRFLPTDDESDCTFCDFAEVCRARSGKWGTTDSPLARWSAEWLHEGLAPEFQHLRAVRSFEE